jgi:hypothetical protein
MCSLPVKKDGEKNNKGCKMSKLASLDMPLTDVKGIGYSQEILLRAKGISTYAQLFGVFLTFKSEGINSLVWQERMVQYLIGVGLSKKYAEQVVRVLQKQCICAFPRHVSDFDDVS